MIKLYRLKLIFATPTQDMSDKVFDVEVQNNPFYDKLSLNIRTIKEETLSIQLLSLSGSVLQIWSQQVNTSASIVSLNPLFVYPKNRKQRACKVVF